MKATLSIVLLLSLVSCGKKTVNKYYENPAMAAEVTKIKQDIKDLFDLINTQGASVNALETLMNNTQARLTELELDTKVMGFVDPCGDSSNSYDEYLLVTGQGQYIAYFEDGGNRYLTVLVEGVNYQTTDKQKCKFKIIDGELVELN